MLFNNKTKRFRIAKLSLLTIFVLGSFLALEGLIFKNSLIDPKPAYSYYCCTCQSTAQVTDTILWPIDEFRISMYIYEQLIIHQEVWFDLVYWELHVLPYFMRIGNQLSSVGMFQVMIIGQFMDAKQQLETQREFQVLRARAHKDFHPSIGMCEFGTRIVSLAASERKGEANALILSKRSTDRLLGNVDTAAADGVKGDTLVRIGQFQREFCNSFDNDNSLEYICPLVAPPATAVQKNRFNKDIDYQRAIEDPWTVDFDLTGSGDPSDGDRAVMAMANNLYGFDSFDRVPQLALENSPGNNVTNAQEAYLGLRATVAKTKVAENSFNAIMAMKGEGTAGSKEYIAAYLEELGIPDTEVDGFLGENPSYNAQMEVLTKKAYQSPLFYTNLYDKPANVERKGAAIQAIGLIQKFDLLKSYLRTEASLSVLLELSVLQLQREVEDNIKGFDKSGITLKD